MSDDLLTKMFDPGNAFSQSITLWIIMGAAGILLLAPIIFELMRRLGYVDSELRKELYARYRSWLVLTPLMVAPVLLGAGCTILAVGVLSLGCYAEFARATGLFRYRPISFVVGLGILLLTFTALDHWYGFFVALPSLIFIIIAIVAVLRDRPRGYIQRVALGVLAFLLFGVCLGHLGYMANDRLFRPLILTILVCVELNDVFAFTSGKLIGRRKLAPHTSQNKTLGGVLGAVLLTTTVFVILGHFTFQGTVLDAPHHLILMGLILTIAAQFGDLVLSSIKRDLGLKDMGTVIPGHGGLLDRFDSLLLVAPAIFHYVGYFRGIGLDQATRIITGMQP